MSRNPIPRTLGFLVLACLIMALTGRLVFAQWPAWPSELPPGPLAVQETPFPPYEVRTLSNGLRVATILNDEQPVVTIRLLVGAGAVNDPNDKPGLALFLSQLIDQGTATKTAQEIAETIDSIGGALNVGAGVDVSFINIIVMKDSFELAINLLSDLIRSPALALEEVDRQRQQIISSLTVSYDDPGYLAETVFTRLVYGLHPYGQPSDGTFESISKIAREDLVNFHQTYFFPNNSVLAIVGDITAEEAFESAKRILGDWQPKDIPSGQWMDPPTPTRRIVVVDKPGAVQTAIRLGHIGVLRKNSDYRKLDLVMKLLGGEGSNRLQQILRSERGLTYAASADMVARKYSGDFMAETDTRSEATGEALRLMVQEFWRLIRDRVSQSELGSVQAYLSGNFPLTIETPNAIASRVLNLLFFDLDLDELENFGEQVNEVTTDDIQRTASFYLKPDRLSIVMVGDASTFVDDLERLGFDNYELIPIDELDLLSPNFLKSQVSSIRAGLVDLP